MLSISKMGYNFVKLLLVTVIVGLLPTNSDALPSSLFLELVATLRRAKTFVLPTNNDEFFKPNYTDNKPIDFGTYDFIIVGGGTAGGVLAYRLTEKNYTVLIIEAGNEDPPVAAILGVGFKIVQSPYNWGYNTVPQKHACFGFKNQSCIVSRGKTLGGTSVINSGIYSRPSSADVDRWAALGNAGWSFKDCLPYFKKSERAEFNIDIDKDYHGFEGPQNIGVVNDTPEVTTMLLDAFKELGKKQGDYNGRNHHTVSRVQSYIDFNIRSSTAHSFIKPARNRSNLHITLKSLATKIKILNGKARGVQFVKRGKNYFAGAKKEVIVSGGSINSPQLLMLSGIGPRKELNKHGIKVLKDLPVGEYLSDHLALFTMSYRTRKNYFATSLRKSYQLWKQGKRPLNGAVTFQVVSFWNFTNNRNFNNDVGVYVFGALDSVDLDIFRFTDEYKRAFKNINTDTDINVPVILFYPKSYGKVTLQSKSPRDFPLVDPNYLSEPSDIENLYKGIKIALQLNNTTNFKKSQTKYIPNKFPGCDEKFKYNSKKWWYCGIRHSAFGIFHPISTTRMGTSPKNSVVNSELKVHGIKGLRVVDAGVIPSQFSGHPNAVVVMIAEKIADAIKAEHN